jgi:GrpB-like predicted nucleotidyltransferase (UPF0157 family)
MLESEEPVRIVDPDPDWPARFAAEGAGLRELLEPWLDGGVHHVGSTAVAGLAAKPTIDILAGVTSLAAAASAIPVLEAAGWTYAPYRPDQMHWFCKPSPARRDFHLHLVPRTSSRFDEELAFRDALRADADLAQAYAVLKRELAARHPEDREAYTEAKSGFIAGVLQARQATRAALRPTVTGDL